MIYPIRYFIIIGILLIPILSKGKVPSHALMWQENPCTWSSVFQFPQKSKFVTGERIYVRVEPQKKDDIAYISLYINDQFVRKESQYPYEWNKYNSLVDKPLHLLNPGQYKLKAKIVDRCGGSYFIYQDIRIELNPFAICHFINPVFDLAWLKAKRDHYPSCSVVEYRKNGKSYFQIVRCGLPTEEWFDCHGNLICSNLQGATLCMNLQGAIAFKTWYNQCLVKIGCEAEGVFRSPSNNQIFQTGSSVYVRLEPKKPGDIQFMELYLNGTLLRKETSYPFEWCKSSNSADQPLRSLSAGIYHIQIKVKDKCGSTWDRFCTFSVQ